ncbi:MULTISPECIES: hypothetical protein [unclassified Streptomyces]|uniref:hypothetical protein n=1 Tax=Streptomyces sp. NPDC127129 TaxID=3345373 RepID=UPI00362D5692
MSAPDERGALTPRPSLYDYALRRSSAEPGGRLPDGGYPLPGPPPRPLSPTELREARQTAIDAITPFLTDPDPERAADGVHRRLDESGLRNRHVRRVVDGLPLEDETAARALARRLTRTGSGSAAVALGVGLLARLGEPEDVPFLRILGLFQDLTVDAVRVLDGLDRPTAALVWLAVRVEDPAVRPLVDALAAGDDAAARAALTSVPTSPRAVGPETARRIAEAVRLADVLREGPVDPGVLAQAARLLSRMTSQRDYRPAILLYDEAVTAYESVVERAALLPPSLDHCATLLSLALDLHSGPSSLLPWRPGSREALLDTLESVLHGPGWTAVADLDSEDPAERRRIQWIRRTTRQPFGHRAVGAPRLRIEVAVRDPADPDVAETRPLIDGRPLLPKAFGLGPGNAPERLLDSGRLRATAEPREVQLAEAYCTEGCCGALYVTVQREGDQVVWRDWRRPSSVRRGQPELPAYRFDAADYDAEIARAESDHSWAWPARITARLLAAGLRDRPDLLTRWDARFGWVGTDYRDPDTTVLSFTYQPGLAPRDGLAGGRLDMDRPWLQFVWNLPDDDTPPEARAAAALARLETTDPKTFAQVRGGSREHAEALGLPWPADDGNPGRADS